ncbi:MAG: alkaline shock response membrane anchor protein AmaP, partial [Anaerolineae bacterium]
MNVFNRIVMVILLLAIIALVVVTLRWPFATISVIRGFLDWTEAHINVYTWPLMLAGGILIGLLCLLLIILELRRPRRKMVPIRKVSGGRAFLLTESVARRLGWHIGRLSDVSRVTPMVWARGRGVDVRIDLETAPQVNVPMKTEEVLAVVREQVEDKMGLKLRRVRVQVRSAPFPKEPAVITAPAPPPPPPWPAEPAPSTPPTEEPEQSPG